MIRFCVSATGIAPDALDRIFEPFIQLDCSLARRLAGTGLGLALVRRLAEIHWDSVECTSTPGRGSAFVVCLPQGLPGPARQRPPRRRSLHPHDRRGQTARFVPQSSLSTSTR